LNVPELGKVRESEAFISDGIFAGDPTETKVTECSGPVSDQVTSPPAERWAWAGTKDGWGMPLLPTLAKAGGT
jgi:hypothetical protein